MFWASWVLLLATLGAEGPEPAVATRPPNNRTVAVSVSGGASLGAYEAGYLYYITDIMRASPVQPRLRLMAGASAGAINSLLTIINAYSYEPHTTPEESLNWRVWIPLSVQALYRPDSTTAVSLLSREPLENVAAMVEKVWQQGLRDSCDMIWAVPTTRLHPRSISLAHGSLELPRTEEKFAIRIRGRGPGKPPSARNYVDARAGMEQATLVTDADGEVPFSALKELIFASSAFPGAFAPQRLKYCLASSGQDTCAPQDAIEGLFVDGGVLDNAPLRLAVRLIGSGLRPTADGGTAWLEHPRLDEVEVPDDATIGFISPESADYPTYEATSAERMPDSFLDLGVQFAEGFVAVARSKELYTIMEERPELRQNIYIPRRGVPTFSALLGEFLGFFERDFRIFDFALGMVEARRNMLERVERAAQRHEAPPPVTLVDARAGQEAGAAWSQFNCLSAVLQTPPGHPLPPQACAETSQNQRILAQTAIIRLYDNCARLEGTSLKKTRNAHCLAASTGMPPPVVVAHDSPVRWRRDADEPELRYLLRLLASYGFEFHDMGLPPTQADRAPAAVRAELDRIAASFANKQVASQQRVVSLGARLAIDAVTQAPVPLVGFVTLAEMLEGGVSWLLPVPDNRWVRLNAAAIVDGLGRIITSNGGKIALGAAAGLEFEQDGENALLQLRALARAGYMFAQGDGFGGHTCQNHASEQLGDCSRMLVQLAVGATVLENLRLQLAGSWYPPLRTHETSLWAVTPGVGLQF